MQNVVMRVSEGAYDRNLGIVTFFAVDKFVFLFSFNLEKRCT